MSAITIGTPVVLFRLVCVEEDAFFGIRELTFSFSPTNRNLIPSKEFFFFGTDAVETKSLASYGKHEKSQATYHANTAWASETGKGLLFIGDKKAPTGIINLVSLRYEADDFTYVDTF